MSCLNGDFSEYLEEKSTQKFEKIVGNNIFSRSGGNHFGDKCLAGSALTRGKLFQGGRERVVAEARRGEAAQTSFRLSAGCRGEATQTAF